MKNIITFVFVFSIILFAVYLYYRQKPSESVNVSKDIEIIAGDLKIPWEVAFLPAKTNASDSEILVTERPGLLVLLKNRQRIPVEGVAHVGEGGLLGLALHPDFTTNRLIYLYLTSRENGVLANRVERYKLEGNSLADRQIIIEGIAGSSNHDGGRIAFGPDRNLYITTGDAGDPDSAQDVKSLNGKILRVRDDGSIPLDNPFNTAVYSYGHRNPQGLVWDGQENLWATEHGRSGSLSGFDELNLIEKGKNYGWPVIEGDEKREDMVTPLLHSGSDKTWAPAGAAFLNGKIYFGGLRGEAIFAYDINKGSLKEYFKGEFGRIRAVVLGKDGFLYITTSNTDGRGSLREGDDKLIKIDPASF